MPHTTRQCDQTDRLFVQYVAIYNNKNLPTKFQNFAKYNINPYNVQRLFKFRQKG